MSAKLHFSSRPKWHVTKWWWRQQKRRTFLVGSWPTLRMPLKISAEQWFRLIWNQYSGGVRASRWYGCYPFPSLVGVSNIIFLTSTWSHLHWSFTQAKLKWRNYSRPSLSEETTLGQADFVGPLEKFRRTINVIQKNSATGRSKSNTLVLLLPLAVAYERWSGYSKVVTRSPLQLHLSEEIQLLAEPKPKLKIWPWASPKLKIWPWASPKSYVLMTCLISGRRSSHTRRLQA